MNLVKAQALANDLPPDMLKKYADGFDPRIIPPWIATGTLQAKIDLNRRMQNMMGGARGEQPSVKEQIEQKAGLMAANTMQQRQQQAQQQMAMGQRPGPAPAGIPQPEDQPEAPTQMARGGLASVPVEFAFKPGGIVGYSKGGEVDAAREEAKQAIANLRSYGTLKMREDPEGYKSAQAAATQARARLQAAEAAYAQEMGGANRAAMNVRDIGTVPELMQPEEPVAQPVAQRPASVSEARATAAAGPQAAVPPAPRQERPAPRPDAPRPTAQAAQTGLAAAASRSPYFAQADAALNAPNVQPTPQGIIAEQRALSPQAMQEETMRQRYEERKARADQERAAFEKTRPSGLDDLIRVFGQAGQYKGMSGLAPAYTANQQQKRAEELALEKRMNELYTAADTQEFAGAKELFESRTKSMDAANKSYQERLKSRAETLAQLAGVDERRIQSELDRLTQMEIQKLRMAEASRGTPDQQLFAQFLKLKSEGKTKEAKVLLDSLDEFKGAGKNQTDQILKMKLEPIYKARVEAAGLPGEIGAKKLAELDRMEQEILRGTKPAGGSATPLPANASPANLNVGTVYQTAKGPAKWTGTGFAPV
jgi:hypothetical protein